MSRKGLSKLQLTEINITSSFVEIMDNSPDSEAIDRRLENIRLKTKLVQSYIISYFPMTS